MEQPKERSQRDQGLALGALSRLLSSIPDRVAGQESQFAEFPIYILKLSMYPFISFTLSVFKLRQKLFSQNARN